MKNPIPANHRFAITLLAAGFGLGAAFQLGVSTVSHFKPRVEVIEIRTQAKASPKGIAQRLEF
ncbi:hypothetical protein QT231_22935 [Halomonas sp. SpR1]|uniref:hypothetical protein n=1 Tax=Halomonas sp. SpR1 TaxID=3050462 RepID=UPI0027E42482|nr:hypothetical protein [Halomonas sp. SpR1]MDQ7735566.1 hypothetical protein [Halomonas sp. SpR1]